MIFLADESVDYPIVKSLRDNGFEVDYISEIKSGISDDEVIELARQNSSILITADKDFGTLTFRKKMVSEGIILYRLSGLSNMEKAKHVLSVVSNYSSDLKGSFTVIGKDHIRIRKLPDY